MIIAIASDHAGLEIKDDIKKYLSERKEKIIDLGTLNNESVDYPDYGMKVAEMVSKGKAEKGILVCGTGIGMSIVANKYPGVRAALVTNKHMAKMAKEHNDANILVLPGREAIKSESRELVQIWLDSAFQGGKHQKRLDKISEIEKSLKKD